MIVVCDWTNYIYIYIKIVSLSNFACRLVVFCSASLSTNITHMLPNTVSESRQWDGCPTRLMMGHCKFTYGHYMSREHPLTCEDWRRHHAKNKTHPNRKPSLNNTRRQLFSSNKTMKQLLNDGDTPYGDTLYKFVINIDLLTKLWTINENTLNNYNSKRKSIEKHLGDHNLILWRSGE